MATQVITSTSRQSSYKRASSSLFSKTEKMSFFEKDEDIWKNYQDYPDGYDNAKEKKLDKEDIKKIIIAVSCLAIIIPTGIVAIKKRLAIRVILAIWIHRINGFFHSISERIRNIRREPPTVELSVIHPSQISIPLSSIATVPTPPPPRYLTDRPIVMLDDREASERRLREVSAVLNEYFHRPLPQFHHESESLDLSTAASENRVSTPIEDATYWVEHNSTISIQSLDPAGLLNPPPVAPNNTLVNPLMEISVSNGSVGSVMAIEDFQPIRQQPQRATRNKVPIYVDPSENDDE